MHKTFQQWKRNKLDMANDIEESNEPYLDEFILCSSSDSPKNACSEAEPDQSEKTSDDEGNSTDASCSHHEDSSCNFSGNDEVFEEYEEIQNDNDNYEHIFDGTNVRSLFDNSPITVDEYILDLLNLYVEHKHTKASLAQMLKLVLKPLPENNLMPKSVYHLFKYVEDLSPPCCIRKHYYCRVCYFYNGCDQSLKNCLSCESTDLSYFFELDIADQIKHIFEHRGLAEKLRVPTFNDNNISISDITDGSDYIRVNMRQDRKKYDLTLMLNTDGLSLVTR